LLVDGEGDRADLDPEVGAIIDAIRSPLASTWAEAPGSQVAQSMS
jgi:hypothetical protein